jgi:hypothetical protein
LENLEMAQETALTRNLEIPIDQMLETAAEPINRPRREARALALAQGRVTRL